MAVPPDLDLTQLPNTNLRHLTGFTPGNIISAVLQITFAVAGILAVVFLLIGGAQFIMSAGDKEGLDKARKIIRNALIGLAIVLFIYIIGGILNNLFHVDLFNVCIPGATNPIYSCASSGVGANFASTTAGPGPIPAGACGCYNGGWLPNGSIAPGTLGGTCYTCNSGTWGSPTFPPGGSCPSSVTCN